MSKTTIDTLAAALKGEPGIWSISPTSTQGAPAGDPAETRHGRGERPPIPSYSNRMLITVAVDAVRLYYLAGDLEGDALNQVALTNAAQKLYTDAKLDSIPEADLVKHILGHWPLPPPSLWLLRVVNAVGAYLTVKAFAQPGDPLLAAATNRLQDMAGGIGDGGSGAAGGGH
jgi:hypothetical protein